MRKIVENIISLFERAGNLPEDARRNWARILFVLIFVPAIFLWFATMKFSIGGGSGKDMFKSATSRSGELLGQVSKGIWYFWGTLQLVRQEVINEIEKESPPQEPKRVHLPIIE